MRIAQVLIVVGLVAAIFGYWGTYTNSGRFRFDEMAGILPFFSLICGVGLTIVGGIVWIWLLRRPS